jgi:HSP20 family protein
MWNNPFYADAPRRSKFRREGYRRPKYNVPVNIIEHADAFEVQVFALTYPKDGIKVAVVEDTLYLSGKRHPEHEAPNFLLQEYPIKSFERSFELSQRVDKSGIKASHQDGILTIHVPKAGMATQPEQEIEVE